MTKQQFIIKSLLPYFKDPSKRGTNAAGTCKYLTPEGKKCAVGQYILPSKYHEEIENMLISEALGENQCNLKKSVRGILSTSEFRKVQQVHDNLLTAQKDFFIKEVEKCCNVDLSKLKALLPK